jgi:hypothetical protein
MATINSDSLQAATVEGMSFFWAHMHVGHSTQFVGQCWEDGGFGTDDEGNPVRDCNGNSVAKFSVEDLDAANAQHVNQVNEWYG